MVDVIIDRRGDKAVLVPGGAHQLLAIANRAQAVLDEVENITQGPPGPADNTYTTLAAFKASDPLRHVASLVGVSGVPDGRFYWTGAYDGPQDGVNVIFSDSDPTGGTGAWVREGAQSILYRQPIAGAVARSLAARLREIVFITDFGAVGDGVTNNDAALAAARAYMASRAAAGGLNTMELVWPAGRYIYTVSPNWGIQRLRMRFEGEVWLIRTGTGPAFIADGGASGSGLLGLQILGYPYIVEDGTPNHSVYMRAIHSSRIELRSVGAGVGDAEDEKFSAFYGEWLVDNDISFVVSGLEGGIYKVPAYAMHFTNRVLSEECSYNRVQVRISGDAVVKIPVGVFLDGALGNKITGTIQNCTLGFRDTTNSWQNVFDKVDWEANVADAEVHGEQTQFVVCDFEKGPVFKSDALDCSMIGGSTVNITVESGALNTLLSSLTYNRRRIPGTGVITNNSPSTRFRDLKNGKTGVVHDVPPERTVVTVGASPFTYTNTTGNNQALIISGGTLSILGLGRGGLTDAISVQTGQVVLMPNDRLYIEYSSPPTLVRWS